MHSIDTFVVITGGPGAGKTTLINGLRQRGFPCVDEAGRQIIRDQSAIGGSALHTADQLLFAEIMLAWEMRSYRQAAHHDDTTVFFDRGIPDLVGYYLLLDRPVPRHVSAAVDLFRYHHRVFVAPPWPDIYATDSERQQDFDEAVRTHDAMVTAYTRHGYELITLPKTDPASRLAFMHEQLGVVGPHQPTSGIHGYTPRSQPEPRTRDSPTTSAIHPSPR
ncbi:AAA family ATPase [Actinoplanes siamensis]|uniref:ATPase n=1 Tax=Actinoplanes siamensis TaxID=1223317 RepID=A0A919KBM0_9ACTN|nr:AAA family ATPase [Actinoplanes siamensis]GIF02536.1 ATPase [Actinoplanes siamensis]